MMDELLPVRGYPLLLIAAAIVLVVVVLLLLLRRSRKEPRVRSRHVEALNALLEGDEDTALQELRRTVQAEQTNIDAYIRLGNLLRKRGAVERALRIHRDLDVGTFFRRKLTRVEKFRIREAIADDLLAGRRPQEALQVLGELLQQDRENQRIRSKMVAIYERQSRWDKAFELFREGLKVRKEKSPGRLAQYRAFCGTSLLVSGDAEKAERVFREALKLDPGCPEALYRLGLLKYEAEKLEESIAYWERFHKAVPSQAYLTFERFERALFETGNLNRMEEVYKAILEESPREERTLLALSTFHARRGEEEEAVTLARRAVEYDPSSFRARNHFVLLLCETRGAEEAVTELTTFLRDNPPPTSPFLCSNCGYEAQAPFWRCPQCLRWNTAFPDSARLS